VEPKVKCSDVLPEYSAELAAFHRAHRPELRQIIAELNLPVGARVLDLACGDGAYSQWIANEVGDQGCVVGADRSPAYLQLARSNCDGRSSFIAASATSLPFPSGSFDAAWCAQSLISLPEPLAVVEEMLRVVRDGGCIAILENDSLHQLILPWPEELELAIRSAELTAYRKAKHSPRKRYVGRRLSALMRKAAIKKVVRRTYATDRVAPLDPQEQIFLTQYLRRLRKTVWPYLSSQDKSRLDELVSPDSPRFMLAQPDFEMTWLDVVCVGQK
jgi:ubiquinone/menaquinone biosynthesis C-methylase UbiE